MKSIQKFLITAVVILILLLALVSGFSLYRINKLQDEQQQLSYQAEAMYQRNFGELADSIQAMNEQLAQLLVTTSQEQLLYGLSSLWREVYSAITSLGSLPVAMHELEQTDLLLHDVAEYSYHLMRTTVLNHKPLTMDDWNRLSEFYQRSSIVQKELTQLESTILSENFQLSSSAVQNDNNLFVSAFRSIEQQIESFPQVTLAEGVRKIEPEPRPINGTPIDEAEAIKIANRFRNILNHHSTEKPLTGTLSFVANASKIPVYGIAYPDNSYVEVSQTGGHVLQYYHSKSLQPGTLSDWQAEAQAVSILQQLQFPDMVCVERNFDDETASFIFVPLQEQIYLYPDMVKLQLALDDGTLLNFDQTSFQTRHYPRTLSTPKLSREEIIQHRNPNFHITSIHLALITDTYSINEILTYEIRGNLLDESFSIFIDAQTGKELRIVHL